MVVLVIYVCIDSIDYENKLIFSGGGEDRMYSIHTLTMVAGEEGKVFERA